LAEPCNALQLLLLRQFEGSGLGIHLAIYHAAGSAEHCSFIAEFVGTWA